MCNEEPHGNLLELLGTCKDSLITIFNDITSLIHHFFVFSKHALLKRENNDISFALFFMVLGWLPIDTWCLQSFQNLEWNLLLWIIGCIVGELGKLWLGLHWFFLYAYVQHKIHVYISSKQMKSTMQKNMTDASRESDLPNGQCLPQSFC